MIRGVTTSFVLAALAGTSALAITSGTQAQTAPAATADVDPGTIIVSARRREEALQDTPVAITAIAASQIESKGAINMGDLMGAAPNLLITQQNSGSAAANLAIRGLTYADIEKSQEPTVAVVVDGVFIGTSTGQFFDFFDIQQIEVLRGPQGTLFGRNTIGGVINIQRTRPTGDFGVKAEVSYAKFNSLATRAVVNVPIGNGDALAAKAFYFHNETDGYYRNAITGKRAGGSNNENFGISFLILPDDSNFDALITVEKQVQSFDPVNPTIAKTGELFCTFQPARECNRNTTDDLYTVFTTDAFSNYSAPSVTGEMNFDAGPVKLTSVTGYRSSKELQTQDFDSSSVDLYFTRRQQEYRQFSQEIRGAGQILDNLDYVVGGYYFSSRFKLLQYTRLFAFNPNLDPRTADAAPQLVNGRTKSVALFGDFNWAFADQWRLSFGGRWTRDKKSLNNAFGGVRVGSGEESFGKFTPKVGVDYRPNDNTMLYASWSRGYRSGGFSPRAATPATASTAYQPETVDSFEVGSKLDLMDSRVQLNIAAFYSKYNDMQQNTTIPGGPTGNQTITSNVASAKIKGIEVDFVARATDNLKFSGSLGLLDANFDTFLAGNINSLGAIVPFDYSANRLIYAPKINGSINAEYKADVEFGEVIANLGYRYIGKYDQQISLGPVTGTNPVIVNGNDPRVRSDTQGLLDASLTARFTVGGSKAWATVYGRNLADDRGTSAAFTVAGLWSFASAREPRTFGGTLGFEF
jgi:iron complex outermembrane recepter protein